MAGTLRCPRCGRDNDASFAFCPACSQELRPQSIPTPVAGRPTPIGGRPTPALGATETRRAAALRLVAIRHDGLPGPTFALTRAPLHCGRTEGELRFPDDATVSPRHCRFSARDDGAWVEDLGSLNGTFLRLRQPRSLAPGDVFRVGRQLLRLDPAPRPEAGGEARPWGAPDGGHAARVVQLLEGGGTGEAFPLRPGENPLGRESGAVSFPTDRYVSARHARLDVAAGAVVLTDVGSSNGTFVRLAGAARLASGDQVLVGMQLLRVEG